MAVAKYLKRKSNWEDSVELPICIGLPFCLITKEKELPGDVQGL
jgi:hypothetical protein